DGVRWDRSLIADFLGRFLTMPKAQVKLAPPRRRLTEEAFARRLRGRGRLALALPSRGLVRRGRLFLNGESHRADRATMQLFRALVTARSVALPQSLDDRAVELLHAWYLTGWVLVHAD